MRSTTKFITIIFLFSLLSINLTTAETYTAFTKIVGVDNRGEGIVGNVTVEIQPGKGRVLVDTMPLQGIYTQDSERIAVKVASDVTGFDFSNYDTIYTIVTPDANVVEGPSAGGAMTLATIAAIEGNQVSESFSITGTINEDHSIGRVGGILAKAEAAAKSGVTVFLVPKGETTVMQYVKKVKRPAPGWYIETIEPVPLDLVEYAEENWEMKVYEVASIEEVMEFAFGEIPESSEREFEPVETEMFLPMFGSPVKQYLEFERMARKEIQRAELSYSDAKNKLDSSSLPDDIRTGLDSLLTKSKSSLNEANQIIDQGYEYSAGNNAFRSTVNSETVMDLVDYYSTSSNARKLFVDERVDDASRLVDQTKREIEIKTGNAICDVDKFEWAVAARQRISYAINRLESIEELSEDEINPVEVFFDINVVEEWIEISKSFASKATSNINSTCLSQFESKAFDIVDDVEKELGISESRESQVLSDAEWYVKAARRGLSNGWYITALYDATSAKVRSEIETKYEDKSITQIYEAFNDIQLTTSDLIGTIYFEHAQYLMYSAVKNNDQSSAVEAIELLELAKETNDNFMFVGSKLETERVGIDALSISDVERAVIIVLVISLILTILYVLKLRSDMRNLEEEYMKVKLGSKKVRMRKVKKDIMKKLEQELKVKLKKKEITKKEYEELKKDLLKK